MTHPLLYNGKLGKLEQKLFGSGIDKLDGGFGILARALQLQNRSYPETLMLYLGSFHQSA